MATAAMHGSIKNFFFIVFHYVRGLFLGSNKECGLLSLLTRDVTWFFLFSHIQIIAAMNSLNDQYQWFLNPFRDIHVDGLSFCRLIAADINETTTCPIEIGSEHQRLPVRDDGESGLLFVKEDCVVRFLRSWNSSEFSNLACPVESFHEIHLGLFLRHLRLTPG